MAKGERRKSYNRFLELFTIIALITSGCMIYCIYLYQGVETFLRYVIMGLMITYDLHLIVKCFKTIRGKLRARQNKPWKRILFLVWLIIYSGICFFVAYELHYVYDRLKNTNKTDVIYTSYLVVMSSNPIDTVKDAKGLKLGLLNDKKNPDGYIVPQIIIKENKLQDTNEILDYDDYSSMLADLYAEEIDGIFIPSGYVSMFSNITGYESIATDTKVIGEASKKMKKTQTSKIETASSGKSVTEPFTILLMGIDSTDDVLEKNAIANGDTLILITFNPKTLNATMLSIPRDSYVPIACWSGKPENKITHAAAYGNDCMINTIQNYFEQEIDYYVKINFKGLVKLVDAVGGVEVDVPQELCTDDSSRWAEVCIQPGHQVLNGEQALVFARNRKALVDGDFGRARHQQEIIMALINKMKEVKDISTFMKILDTVSDNMDTNLTTKQILSFYNIGKDIVKKSLSSDEADIINIERLYLQGTGQMIYDERARMVLWDYVPNTSSRKDIINAMNENLEKTSHTVIKSFSFSINNPYEKKVIGEGPYANGFAYTLLPDFTGDTEAIATKTCQEYGIKCTFKGTSGTVVDQSEPFRKRIDLIKGGVELTLSGSGSDKDKNKDKDDDKDDDDDDDNKDKDKDKNKDKDDDKDDDDDDNNNPSPSPDPKDEEDE